MNELGPMIGLLSSLNQDDAHDALVGLFCALGASVLILAIIGSTLGQKRRLVVYDGRADLHVTCASIISWACSGIAYLWRKDPGVTPVIVWISWLVFLVSIVLTINSIKRSFRANKTAWKGTLSMFAKFTLSGLLMGLGMVTLGGLVGATEAVKDKRYKNAAEQAAVAALGGMGYFAVRKHVNQLIVEAPSTDADN